MRLADIIDVFIAGDWGNENPSEETPNAAQTLFLYPLVSSAIFPCGMSVTNLLKKRRCELEI